MDTTGRTSGYVIEADGGARGNPGPAAYGALVRDAATGEVLAEAAESIGVATNNVAEYHGLIAGLRLVRELTAEGPAGVREDAEVGLGLGVAVEVRMDSMLVIEQMAGRWKIKHPDMRRLAMEAHRLAPADTTWTHVPRERNTAADALLNRVLDGGDAVWIVRTDAAAGDSSVSSPQQPGQSAAIGTGQTPVVGRAQTAVVGTEQTPAVGWGDTSGAATTLLLLRHGATKRSAAKQFSGSGGEDVPLIEPGRVQADAAATALRSRGGIAAVVTSPLRRARETADVVVGALGGVPVAVEPGLAETSFGAWDGLTFAEVRERWPNELADWLASTSVRPPGGESFDEVLERVRAARDRILSSYQGRTIVVVTHVSPIKLLICLGLGVPARAAFRMELPPGSVSEVRWWPDGQSSVRSFGLVPPA